MNSEMATLTGNLEIGAGEVIEIQSTQVELQVNPKEDYGGGDVPSKLELEDEEESCPKKIITVHYDDTRPIQVTVNHLSGSDYLIPVPYPRSSTTISAEKGSHNRKYLEVHSRFIQKSILPDTMSPPSSCCVFKGLTHCPFSKADNFFSILDARIERLQTTMNELKNELLADGSIKKRQNTNYKEKYLSRIPSSFKSSPELIRKPISSFISNQPNFIRNFQNEFTNPVQTVAKESMYSPEVYKTKLSQIEEMYQAEFSRIESQAKLLTLKKKFSEESNNLLSSNISLNSLMKPIYYSKININDQRKICDKLSNEKEISLHHLPLSTSFGVLDNSQSSYTDSENKSKMSAIKQDSVSEKSLDNSSNSNKIYELEASIAKTSLIESSENNFVVQIKSLPKQTSKMGIQIDDEYENFNSLESDDNYSEYCSDNFSLEDSREDVFDQADGGLIQIDCREIQKEINQSKLRAVDNQDQDNHTYSFKECNNFIATGYDVTMQESSSESSSSEYESERNSNYDTPS